MNSVRLFAASAALANALIWSGLRPADAGAWDESYFGEVDVVTHRGEQASFYRDLVRDRIVVINFIYTECPDICSLSTARLAQVADWLGDRLGRDIFFLSITLDPENDTPEKLAEFARAFGGHEGWTFLTGAAADLDLLGHKLGERSDTLGEHRSDLVIGNARTGEWRRSSPMGSLSLLTREILEMDPGWRPSAEGRAAPEGSQVSHRRGEALFLQACASCHSVGAGARVGPDLAGVTIRRDPAWLAQFIMAPDLLRQAGDPVATALDEAFPGVRMPNLGLGQNDAADVIHYLQSEADRIEAEAAEALTEAGQDHRDGHGHGHDHDHDHHGHGSESGAHELARHPTH